MEHRRKLTVCNISVDKNLLKRAISNLIQNSISHNENGCTIYVSVVADNNKCIICVEDNGIGASDEQIKNSIMHRIIWSVIRTPPNSDMV